MTHDERSTRNWRAGTLAALITLVLAVLGTAITYGRSIVTREDLHDEMQSVYSQMQDMRQQISNLQMRVARDEGRIGVMENDPPTKKRAHQ